METLLVLFIITSSIYGMWRLDEYFTRKREEEEVRLQAEEDKIQEQLFQENMKTLWRDAVDLDREERRLAEEEYAKRTRR